MHSWIRVLLRLRFRSLCRWWYGGTGYSKWWMRRDDARRRETAVERDRSRLVRDGVARVMSTRDRADAIGIGRRAWNVGRSRQSVCRRLFLRRDLWLGWGGQHEMKREACRVPCDAAA